MTIANSPPVVYESPVPTVEHIIASAAAQLVMEEAERRHGGREEWTYIMAGERPAIERVLGLSG